MKFEVVFPVVALVSGWFLGELTGYLGVRREKRAAVAQALTDLLGIRERLLIVRFVVQYMVSTWEIDPARVPEVRLKIAGVFRVPSDVRSRYDSAVTLVSAFDPVLGYRLRLGDFMGGLYERLESVLDPDCEDDRVYFQGLLNMEGELIGVLDSSIRELAKRHGLITSVRIKRLLAVEPKVPEKLDKILREMAGEV